MSTLGSALLDRLVEDHVLHSRPRLQRLWDYYRNPTPPSSPPSSSTLMSGSARFSGASVWGRGGAGGSASMALAQSRGLPARLTRPAADSAMPREVVIENDIAWRIHALADFMFGQPLVIQSLAEDPGRAAQLTGFLQQTFRSNGGADFFHHLALLGSVYGTLDLLVRVPGGSETGEKKGLADEPAAAGGNISGAEAGVQIELIEAPRAIPVLTPGDYRRLDAYAIHHTQLTHDLEPAPWLDRVLRRSASPQRRTVEHTEVWTAQRHQRYISHRSTTGSGSGRSLVLDQPNPLGRLPVVHIQNLAQPFAYEGLSDVEPLIPLQDELNTRLSDRAHRVTFQSFKMYLGKGIENFVDRPVGPGQMWSTDNPEASIHEFGGDAATPSEDHHIREIREAMDKTSGVSPLAAGVIGGRTGNLSSENAIRIVLLGLLARIEKKRLTYGRGIEQLCELVLHAADVSGVLPNNPDERRVRLDWPAPFPDSEAQQLRNAKLKQELGVPRHQLLAELGYADCPDHD